MLSFHDSHCPAPLSCALRAHSAQYTLGPGPACVEHEWVPALPLARPLLVVIFKHGHSFITRVPRRRCSSGTEYQSPNLFSHGIDIEENALCNPEFQKSPCPLYIPKETAPSCIWLCSLIRLEAPGRQKLRLNHRCIQHMEVPNVNKFPTSECPSS